MGFADQTQSWSSRDYGSAMLALQEEPKAGRNGKTTEAPQGKGERENPWLVLPRKLEVKPIEFDIADMALAMGKIIRFSDSSGKLIWAGEDMFL